MNIICISGKAQHGKDTAANLIQESLSEKGITSIIFHNADLLKFICTKLFGWNGEKDEPGRRLLQNIGTEIVREKNPNFWVDFLVNLANIFDDEWDYMIVPDCRFLNEIERFKESGFHTIHIRIIRDDFVNSLSDEQQQHVSEIALDNVIPDYLVHNKNIENLKIDLFNLVNKLLGGKQ